MKTDLLELTTKSEIDISTYLGEVSIEDFITDINDLVKLSSDKELIKKIIKNLEKFI